MTNYILFTERNIQFIESPSLLEQAISAQSVHSYTNFSSTQTSATPVNTTSIISGYTSPIPPISTSSQRIVK